MWILILTLVASSSSTGQAISSVPGFTSQQACLAAGNFWGEQVRKTGEFRLPVAVCVKA